MYSFSANLKFGGKNYKLWDTFPTKQLAESYANDIRKEGDCARVVEKKVQGKKASYGIYRRAGAPRGPKLYGVKMKMRR